MERGWFPRLLPQGSFIQQAHWVGSRHYPQALWEPQDGDMEDSTAAGSSP